MYGYYFFECTNHVFSKNPNPVALNIVIFVSMLKLKPTYYMILLCLMTLMSCRKEKTSWDTEWVGPLVTDSLLITDFVNDSTLSVNSDESVQVNLERNLLDLNLSDLVTLPDTTIDQTFSINAANLTVGPGTQFIDEVKEHVFQLDNITLTKARVSAGKAVMTIKNPIESAGVFKVELPGVEKDGQLFEQTEIVGAAANGEANAKVLTLDLSGYTIDLSGESGNLYNRLQSRMSVTTAPDGDPVTITDQDVFELTVQFEKMKVNYAKGFFGKQRFTDTARIAIPELNAIVSGGVNIEDIDLSLMLVNGVKAEAQGEIALMRSVNKQGDEVGLSHPYFNQTLTINPAVWDWNNLTPSERIISFTESSSNIKAFIENLGNTYDVGYGITLNPWGNTSNGTNEIFPESRIGIELSANFPLNMAISDLVVQDTFDFSYEQQDKLLRVLSGMFLLDVQNKFPFGADIRLFLLDENKEIVHEIEGGQPISPAAINGSGNLHVEQRERIRFPVDEMVVDDLMHVKHIIVSAKFNGYESPYNSIYSNAGINFQLGTKFQLKTEL